MMVYMYLHQLIFKFVSDLQQVGGFLWVLLYRDVPKVFGHCDFLLYISCKTTFFKNIIPKSTCSILMIFLSTKTELNVVLH